MHHFTQLVTASVLATLSSALPQNLPSSLSGASFNCYINSNPYALIAQPVSGPDAGAQYYLTAVKSPTDDNAVNLAADTTKPGDACEASYFTETLIPATQVRSKRSNPPSPARHHLSPRQVPASFYIDTTVDGTNYRSAALTSDDKFQMRSDEPSFEQGAVGLQKTCQDGQPSYYVLGGETNAWFLCVDPTFANVAGPPVSKSLRFFSSGTPEGGATGCEMVTVSSKNKSEVSVPAGKT
ncbi:MAG: hypothetical protein Q9162_007506 [Coniocarpon cinnabarinum]